ncbi:MAG: large repetitive protein, partial [Thermoanaerobaculia bacterium]|nr:large repetitive protein [Thermoanaerobaculia bacterium]
MSSYRNAIRFLFVVLTLTTSIAASAATFDVKALIDSDKSRSTGCNVVTPGGIVSGIDLVVTTTGTYTAAGGSVTGVTRQTCSNPGLNLLSSPVTVDSGWNVGVSPIGDLLIETHLGLDVITMDNVGTPRFVFTSSSGLLSDVLTTP